MALWVLWRMRVMPSLVRSVGSCLYSDTVTGRGMIEVLNNVHR